MSQRERAAWPESPQLKTRGSTQCTLGPVASWEMQPTRGHHFQLKLTKESKEEEEEAAVLNWRAASATMLRSAQLPTHHVPKLQDEHMNM